MSNRTWIVIAAMVTFMVALFLMNALAQGWLGR